MRKAIRVASLILLVLTLGYLLINLGLALWASHGMEGPAASIGIIGGADGPTAIFVTRNRVKMLLPVLGILLPLAALAATRKK